MTAALIALVPSTGVGILFYLVIKAMIEGDRRERVAHAKWEKEQERTGVVLEPAKKAGPVPQNGQEQAPK
jgi:hypothetical protein